MACARAQGANLVDQEQRARRRRICRREIPCEATHTEQHPGGDFARRVRVLGRVQLEQHQTGGVYDVVERNASAPTPSDPRIATPSNSIPSARSSPRNERIHNVRQALSMVEGPIDDLADAEAP
jgi:hypothetical protein